MTYLGMIIDKEASYIDNLGANFEWKYLSQMNKRIKDLISWPGEKTAKELICKIC